MITRRKMIAATLATMAGQNLAAFAAGSAAKVVLVHGRGEAGYDPATLQAEWMKALAVGAAAAGKTIPPNIEVAFPYYGDVLQKFVDQANLPLTGQVIARGGEPNNDFLAFQAEVAESLRAQAGVTDEQVLKEYGDNPKAKGPLNWEWVHAIFRAIDTAQPAWSTDALEEFTRDVYIYLTIQTVRETIDGIVRARIDEKPTIVVAHSLGTIVAFNVLRADTRALTVPRYITIGSPLGVRAIRNQLIPLSYPKPVRAWYNAFDMRDVVALYPLDHANFPVTPSVENYSGVNNNTDNRHGASGYLNDQHVAGVIAEALGS